MVEMGIHIVLEYASSPCKLLTQYNSPQHEPVIAHSVGVASTTDPHVLNEAKVADLVEHQ